MWPLEDCNDLLVAQGIARTDNHGVVSAGIDFGHAENARSLARALFPLTQGAARYDPAMIWQMTRDSDWTARHEASEMSSTRRRRVGLIALAVALVAGAIAVATRIPYIVSVLGLG